MNQHGKKTDRTAADIISAIHAAREIMDFCRAGVNFELGDDQDGVFDGDLFVISEYMERIETDLVAELFEMSRRHFGHVTHIGAVNSAVGRLREFADPVVMERVEDVLPKIAELSRKMQKAIA